VFVAITKNFTIKVCGRKKSPLLLYFTIQMKSARIKLEQMLLEQKPLSVLVECKQNDLCQRRLWRTSHWRNCKKTFLFWKKMVSKIVFGQCYVSLCLFFILCSPVLNKVQKAFWPNNTAIMLNGVMLIVVSFVYKRQKI